MSKRDERGDEQRRGLTPEQRERMDGVWEQMMGQPTDEAMHPSGWGGRLLRDLSMAAQMTPEEFALRETRGWTERVMAEEVQRDIIEAIPEPQRRDVTLTPAQMRVLIAASRGLAVKETAAMLYLSPETVKTELTQARTALGAKNTTHAVAEAIRRGVIP